MAKLISTVHVDGLVFEPDQEVPDTVARLITNPKAWEGGALPDLEEDAPKRPGKRAGYAALAEYAETVGIEIPAEVAEAKDKDALNALLDAAEAAKQGA